jgi:hypothetical protein
MLERPHIESYSIQARICLGIAVLGAAVLLAVMLTGGFVI